ncbi:MAG TPA: kelch repeat-containing protein [Polyangiaceae bacterium]|nr:kelch repeat-containing protein [Polyangiaceae bacterium]
MTTGHRVRLPLVLAAFLAACSSHGASNPSAVVGEQAGAAESSGSPSIGGSSGASGTQSTAGSSTVDAGGQTPGPAQGGRPDSSQAGALASSGGSNAGASGSSVPSALGTPQEKAAAKLPVARQEHSVAAAAGEIYVIGGYNPNVTDSVQAYDPRKDEWRDVKSFPVKMNHGNAAAIDDKIYVAGYYINGGMSTATTDAYAYDPKGDAWSKIASLPSGTQRAASCVAVDAGLMYVIGGADGGKSVANAARYDPSSNRWEELPVLPERREHCSAGIIKGVLYVAGGRADGITGIEPKTWAFDLSTKTWTERAALAPARGGLAGAVLAERFFVFGGEGNTNASSGVFPDIDVYDPTTNQWQTLAPMLVPRHGYGAAVLDNRIYLAGGAVHQGAGGSDEVSVFWLD